MKRSASASISRSSRLYLQKRARELATPKTRSFSSPLAEWALQRVRLEGRPFRFEGHEYLRAIYDDTAPHVVVSKAAQVGGTTWAVLRSLHACLSGLNVMYFFPTRTDVIDFSKTRVGPLLTDNAFLRKQLTETDTAGLKRIGEGYLYLRGMQSTVGMKSVPADMIVFDELDEATPEAKTLARERIAHSDYKRVVELSNPSIPGYGIDEQYLLSDQRHWTLKCPSCGAWTALEREFPERLGQEVRIILPRPDGTYYRACPKCRAELDPDRGEWVADYPDRPIHGYRISQLFSVKVDPGEILRDYQTTRFPERFYNLKIGVPWADLERKLDVPTVLSLCTDRPMLDSSREGYCAMGVDTGKQLHVVVIRQDLEDREHPNRVVHLGVYREFEDLDRLMERFGVNRCVIDAQPDTHSARKFARRHPGRVHLCFFNDHQRGSANWNDKDSVVQVNRTEALDASREAIRDGKVALPQAVSLVHEFARHVTADAKVLDENEETGAMKYRYVRTGENHLSFAFAYAWLAVSELPGPMRIAAVRSSECARAWAALDRHAGAGSDFSQILERY